MTKFKVGDRVKLVRKHGAWCNTNVGKEGVVISTPNTQSEWARVKFDNSEGEVYETDYGDPSHLNPLSTTPPATIQHEGYNYTRGEPVVPEWVKDGAWVVSKDDSAVVQIYVDDRSIGAYNANGTYHSTIEVSKADTYLRPFTNADWKWGMWAEYKGQKVFVMNGIDKTGWVEISGKPIHLKTLNGWNLVPASELTPTTAP